MQSSLALLLSLTQTSTNTLPITLPKTQCIIVAQSRPQSLQVKQGQLGGDTTSILITVIVLLVLGLVGVLFQKPLVSLFRRLSWQYQEEFVMPIKISNVRTLDYFRAEIQGIVYIWIEDKANATSLQSEEGEITKDSVASALEYRVDAAIRQVASGMNLSEIYGKRDNFGNIVKEFLEKSTSLGFSYKDVVIAAIDESNTYNPDNYFDVQGIKNRTEAMQQAILETRNRELEIKPQIREKELEIEKQIRIRELKIELETRIEEATIKPQIREQELDIEQQIREHELEVEQEIDTKELAFQQNHLTKNSTLEKQKIDCELDIEKHRSIEENQLEQEIQKAELDTTRAIETYRAEIKGDIQKLQNQEATAIQLAKIEEDTKVAEANKTFQIQQGKDRANIEGEIQKSQEQEAAAIQVAKIIKDTEVARVNKEFQSQQVKLQQELEKEEIQAVIETIEKEKEKLTKEKERAEALEAITTAIEEARAERVASEAEIIKTLAQAEEIRYKAVPINDVDRMVKLIRDELIGQDKLKDITEVAKALAPQPGILGNSSIYTFANGNGEDINKLMRSTSGMQLIHSLLNGKLGKMLEQTLADNNEDNEEHSQAKKQHLLGS